MQRFKLWGSGSILAEFEETGTLFSIPLRQYAMRRELALYVGWYNEKRPHMYLEGKTPREVFELRIPANKKVRFETRPKWPPRSPCAAPQSKMAQK